MSHYTGLYKERKSSCRKSSLKDLKIQRQKKLPSCSWGNFQTSIRLPDDEDCCPAAFRRKTQRNVVNYRSNEERKNLEQRMQTLFPPSSKM